MESNENYYITRGSALTIDVTLRDSGGAVIASYDGSQVLTTTVWPGGNRAASFTPTTTWTDPSQGTIAIGIAAAQTGALEPGRYQLLTRLDDAGMLIDAYSCTLDVGASAGTGPAPKTYCDYSWLLRFGRSWLRQLQTGDDEAGFAEQLGRARSWIEDLGHAHYRGRWQGGGRSTWLQDRFDADALMVNDLIREAAAKKALAFICEGQVGTSEGSVAYARLARMYHAQADYLGTCLTLSLDADADDIPEVNIDCSCTNAMLG